MFLVLLKWVNLHITWQFTANDRYMVFPISRPSLDSMTNVLWWWFYGWYLWLGSLLYRVNCVLVRIITTIQNIYTRLEPFVRIRWFMFWMGFLVCSFANCCITQINIFVWMLFLYENQINQLPLTKVYINLCRKTKVLF